MSRAPIRLLIAEDVPAIRAALEALVQAEQGCPSA